MGSTNMSDVKTFEPKVRTFVPSFSTEHFEGLKLPPEVMAAMFARFSRTGDGLERILDDIKDLDPADTAKMKDRILKFIDYGHASIGGLTGGIPVGFDKVSMLVPYLTFLVQAKQDGQETSTRFCDFTSGGVANPASLGIPERFHARWFDNLREGFELSRLTGEYLSAQVAKDRSLARIPSDAKPKEAERMVRNYAMDRVRYTLPMAALTNFGIIMTGREWADTLKVLSAFGTLPEFQKISDETRAQLQKFMPNMMRHSSATDMTKAWADEFLSRGVQYISAHGVNTDQLADKVVTSVTLPPEEGIIDGYRSVEERLATAFKGKKNRYDIPRGYPEKIHTSVYWNNMALAEARDINRQRPCKKDTLLAPVGFYAAPEMHDAITILGLSDRFKRFKDNNANLMIDLANSENPHSYSAGLMLGHQTPWELHTDAAHMTYNLELRTGRGVQFRYDDHMRQAYRSFEKQAPQWTKHVQLGTGEPE